MLKGAGIANFDVRCATYYRENGAPAPSISFQQLSFIRLEPRHLEVFAVNTTLTFIDLRARLIEAAAIDEMALGMESNPGIMNLETLDLQTCDWRVHGVKKNGRVAKVCKCIPQSCEQAHKSS